MEQPKRNAPCFCAQRATVLLPRASGAARTYHKMLRNPAGMHMPTLPTPFVADAVWKTQPSRWDDGVRSVAFAPPGASDTTGTLTVTTGGTIPGAACSAFAAWLGEQVPLTVGHSNADVIWTLKAQPSRIPTVAAFAATAWWLRACAAGVEPFTALGTIAHAWSRTPLPAAVAWAFLPSAGLLGWTPTGAASAMVHLRLLEDPGASPGLRLALAHAGEGPPAERIAARAVWTGPRDRALEQAADDALMSTIDNTPFSWSFWHLEPGMGPEDLRGMIRRVESFIDLWPQLQPLQQQLARQGGIEEIGGTAWERPAVAGRQPAAAPADVIAAEQPAPMVLRPAVAVVIPVAHETVDAPESASVPVPSETVDAPESASVPVPSETVDAPESASVPVASETADATENAPVSGPADTAELTDAPSVVYAPAPSVVYAPAPAPSTHAEPSDRGDGVLSPPPPAPVEPPRVAAPLPALGHSAPERELPSPGAPGRFRVELIDPGPNPTRTAELLARALRVSVDEAAAWCAAAPVWVAMDIPAYEVRKIDVVVRLPSGARFQWEQLPTL